MKNHTSNQPTMGNPGLKKTLQEINLAANSLEIFSHSALSDTRTNGRIGDVLMMLRELEQLHADLKQAMEVKS